MTDEQTPPSHVITVPRGTSVYQIPVVIDGQEMEQYVFGEGARSDIPVVRDDSDVLGLFGVWSDLDWEEAEVALYRLRHETAPTPPIDNPDENR